MEEGGSLFSYTPFSHALELTMKAFLYLDSLEPKVMLEIFLFVSQDKLQAHVMTKLVQGGPLTSAYPISRGTLVKWIPVLHSATFPR